MHVAYNSYKSYELTFDEGEKDWANSFLWFKYECPSYCHSRLWFRASLVDQIRNIRENLFPLVKSF